MTSPGDESLPGATGRRLRVLRICHSAVVTSWRERERQLRRRGVDLTLVSAERWNEGGSPVTFTGDGDDFALAARTFGSHPNGFLFDPRPLWQVLGDGPWDVIDVHEEPFGLAAAEVLALRWLRRSHAPVLLYSAQNIDKRYPVPFRWLERWSLRTAAGIYTCNREAGEILRRKGFDGDLVVLPLGVDVDRFRPADRDPPSARLRVGFVGRLSAHKGVDVLIDAAALDERIHVDVFGAGPDAEGLQARAVERGVAGRFVFHGFADESMLPRAFASFDVLAVPSVPVPGWLEQFGRVVVEAQAAGVPSVASASGALPDVVGDAGVLVPPGDPVALCAALGRILDEPGLWSRLRSACAASVGRYSWESVAVGQRAQYERVTASD